MSHIFDALQQSEAERAGGQPVATIASTELLERAERQIVERRNIERQALETDADGSSASEPREVQSSFALKEAPPDAQPRNVSSGVASTAERSKFFSSVQTLDVASAQQDRLACFTDKDSPAAEAFRLLGVRLRHMRKNRRLKTILVTSTVPREGKSFTAANLACVLGRRADQTVLLLEGDLRRPSQSQLFGLPASPGVTECILEGDSLSANVYKLGSLNLWILPSGVQRCNPLDVIQSPKLPALMEQLNAWFDWIIIDSPPILPLADTSAWERVADGILLVTRQGVTEKKKLQRGLEAVESGKLIGALLNSSNGSLEEDYYYYRPAAADSKSQLHLG